MDPWRRARVPLSPLAGAEVYCTAVLAVDCSTNACEGIRASYAASDLASLRGCPQHRSDGLLPRVLLASGRLAFAVYSPLRFRQSSPRTPLGEETQKSYRASEGDDRES